MHWHTIARHERDAAPRPEPFHWPDGWRIKHWGVTEVLPESHCMAGRLTYFHADGFCYDIRIEGAASWPEREWAAQLEWNRLHLDRSKLHYKALSLDEIDDATIRPDGAGRWK